MFSDKIEEFIDSLQIEDLDEETKRVKEITKRLNKSYYEGSDSEEDHCYIVGSLGRDTAVKSFSDIDMLFVLPKELKTKYSNHQGNGQSKLLQDVKKEIKKKYPKTVVRGDGQVVVVSFTSLNKIVEVCPAFERSDGAFDYPDSNNGGSWKKTDPLPEIDESLDTITETNQNFKYICNLVRAWKNNEGFKFGGLLIDTLVYKFLQENESYKSAGFTDYLQLLKDLFKYLKSRDKNQKYWFALGSSQKVYNKKGTFVSKAKKVYEKIEDLTEESENIYDVMREIFGSNFPVPEEIQEAANIEKSALYNRNVRQTEEFIDQKFNIDIRYNLKIECNVKQNGFRDMLLRTMLAKGTYLSVSKRLEFFIVENEFDSLIQDSEYKLHYEVYWKVLNRGEEAIRRDCIRGQIVRDEGRHKKIETTNFRGEHYVECYVIYRNICVAKDRIEVPISNN
ncbi:nucleotide-binding domain-containing protein [Halalkalibacterium halodurans]|uniref:nucleotide-binding domain-containing protein n=1 Tax=Halalkalibacterium halodurans TaxID=86665 RepID=UPI0010FE286D|nr:nucleotidyltransferase [Halalkalibacterium halodurans]